MMNRKCQSLCLRRSAALVVALGFAGCAADKAKEDPRDPMEGWNRGVQTLNDKIDDYVMKPVSKGYQKVTPSVVDHGVTNFYNNVDDIGVIANDLMQFKMLQTGQDIGRVFVNTTVGLAGFVDVANKMNLPKHNEDLDQTLAKWGVRSGPYVVVPFLGPSTPRGVVGMAGDTASNPINWINPVAIPWASGGLRLIDQRADLLSASRIMDEASVDRYEFIRNAYFQQRNYVIHDGSPPLDEELEKQMDMDLEGLGDNSAKDTAPAAQPVSPSAPSTPH